MRFAYFPLFRVRTRNTFYADGRCQSDFAATPSAGTAELLKEYGLRFHRSADGFAVAAEVKPETLPTPIPPGTQRPKLRRLDGTEALRMQFQLELLNPYLVNFSELPAVRPGHEVFYFNNLRNDPAAGRLHLSDSVNSARVGPPVQLITTPMYRHTLPAPAHSGRLDVTDLFGKKVHTRSFDFPTSVDPTPVFEIDLSEIDSIVPGRYQMTDDQGGGQAIFYAPETFRPRPFAVVEIFSSTIGHATGIERVPDTYRMFQGDEVRRVGDFHIQFEARQTTWRYRVTKKYVVPMPGIALDSLQVGDGSQFQRQADGTDKAIFTATAPRPLSETPANLLLNHNGTKKIRTLPSPRPETPLKKEGLGHVSELFIYI